MYSFLKRSSAFGAKREILVGHIAAVFAAVYGGMAGAGAIKMQIVGVQECHFSGLDGMSQFRADLAGTRAAGHPDIIAFIPFKKRDEKQHKISIVHPNGSKIKMSAAFAEDVLIKMQLLFTLIDTED